MWFQCSTFSFTFFIHALCCFVTTMGYEYKMKTFDALIDHFSFSSQETFPLRYAVNDSYWKGDGGPVFFYTGNEGTIELFIENTGFIWEAAPDFNALIVFAEHRYYGKSLPFGNDSFSSPNKTGYLTSLQAIADFVDLIQFLKANVSGARNSPFIAIGGSYGGMLSAWFKMKYPHIIAGAIASSAPIWQFAGMNPCNTFAKTVTADFTRESPECSNSIRRSWKAIDNVTASDEGRSWLSDSWRLCEHLAGDGAALKEWLSEIYEDLAMMNFPYAAKFHHSLPAYPIKAVCSHLTDSSLPDRQLLDSLFRAVSVYFNHTGDARCLDTDVAHLYADLGTDGWDYQTCTEVVQGMCQDGVEDMFEPYSFDFASYSDSCYSRWGVRPSLSEGINLYGGRDISTAANIVLTNGLLDPWSGLGVLRNVSETAVALVMPDTPHHLDLRASNPADPASVRRVREILRESIGRWAAEHRAALSE
ncbi:lysosomal Pro-X carboxypeptidase-like [Bacillus rossius redtenbacheri]|uniref:lysosomal Pro-X carboxypeptidase-like n=1 Tax=Bacillus rossius redtenbacheri TaxID=93214 RepID=UPI002FDD2E98